jgi:hypothetical protein
VSRVTGSGTAARQHQHPLSMQPLKGFRDIADEQQTKGHIDGAAVRMGTRVVLVLEVRRDSVEEARNEVAEIKGRGIAPSVIGWLGEWTTWPTWRTLLLRPRQHHEISANARARHIHRAQGLADAEFFLTGASTALRGPWWWWTESICDPGLARFETCRPCASKLTLLSMAGGHSPTSKWEIARCWLRGSGRSRRSCQCLNNTIGPSAASGSSSTCTGNLYLQLSNALQRARLPSLSPNKPARLWAKAPLLQGAQVSFAPSLVRPRPCQPSFCPGAASCGAAPELFSFLHHVPPVELCCPAVFPPPPPTTFDPVCASSTITIVRNTSPWQPRGFSLIASPSVLHARTTLPSTILRITTVLCTHLIL